MPEVRPVQVVVDEATSGAVLSVLRKVMENASWSEVRRMLSTRRVSLNGTLCIDEGRKVLPGEKLEVHVNSLPVPPSDKDVVVRWLDQSVVVVEKPAGMVTLRRSNERIWSYPRRMLQPTLDECVSRLLEARYVRSRSDAMYELFPVHRIDRDTSGLLMFARTEEAQARLIDQFAAHHALRKYWCVIPGFVPDQTIRTHFIRDRGDGLRGSSRDAGIGQHAVTHIRTLRRLGEFSEVECRLETGRTNQIRIHLAELGHPVCGDLKYRGPVGQPPVPDHTRVPRLALHAAELGFVHPLSGESLVFETPWPPDMARFLKTLTPATDASASALDAAEKTEPPR